jgi:light-harvesting complex I chlorophyll a/b binding protein 1
LDYPENLRGYVGDEAAFDPFRFSDFVPVDFLRESELKHGRIAMAAWAGFVAVDLGFRVYPVPEAYEGLTSVTAHDALVEQGAMGQLLLWFSLAEVIATVAVIQMLQGSGREPGDYKFDPLKFMANKSEEEVKTMKLKELTNGRLAMVSSTACVDISNCCQHPITPSLHFVDTARILWCRNPGCPHSGTIPLLLSQLMNTRAPFENNIL